MKEILLDNSLNELFDDALNMQIGCVELPLAPLFVLSLYYGESFGGRGFKMISSMITYCDKCH